MNYQQCENYTSGFHGDIVVDRDRLRAGVAAASAPVPNITWLYSFEKGFDGERWLLFYQDYVHWSFFLSALYLALVFWGRHRMANRPKYDLQIPLFIWNVVLALFSLHGAHRTVFELVYLLREHGFQHSVCRLQFPEHRGVVMLWLGLFVFSKLVEFGDTAFIILRKKPLHFLHWYHHITVFVYTAYSAAFQAVTGRWFSSVNYSVHSAMYTYYALKSLRVQVPRFVSMALTLAQLSQMVVGLVVTLSAYGYLRRGEYCHVGMNNIIASLAMYGSYFLLFVNFFWKAYFGQDRRKKPQLAGPADAKELRHPDSATEASKKRKTT